MRTIVFYLLIFSWAGVWKFFHPSDDNMPTCVAFGIVVFSLFAVNASWKSSAREELGKLVLILSAALWLCMWKQYPALHVIPDTLYLLTFIIAMLVTQRAFRLDGQSSQRLPRESQGALAVACQQSRNFSRRGQTNEIHKNRTA